MLGGSIGCNESEGDSQILESRERSQFTAESYLNSTTEDEVRVGHGQ